MSKHTPGPWIVSPTLLGKACDVGGADGANIALVRGPEENGPDEFLANARLIKAAPKLLSALKDLLEPADAEQTSARFANARAAIKEATGENA